MWKCVEMTLLLTIHKMTIADMRKDPHVGVRLKSFSHSNIYTETMLTKHDVIQANISSEFCMKNTHTHTHFNTFQGIHFGVHFMDVEHFLGGVFVLCFQANTEFMKYDNDNDNMKTAM